MKKILVARPFYDDKISFDAFLKQKGYIVLSVLIDGYFVRLDVLE